MAATKKRKRRIVVIVAVIAITIYVGISMVFITNSYREKSREIQQVQQMLDICRRGGAALETLRCRPIHAVGGMVGIHPAGQLRLRLFQRHAAGLGGAGGVHVGPLDLPQIVHQGQQQG